MGKVVFITGASKGIGLETAKLLAEKGYKVYGGARSDFNAKGVTSVKLDVTDTDSVANAVKYITDKEGGIDILINNAGMGISDAIENTPEEQSKYIFEVNFFGPFRLIKHCLPYLRKSGGKIINISSVAAVVSYEPGRYKPSEASFVNRKININKFHALFSYSEITTFIPLNTRFLSSWSS